MEIYIILSTFVKSMIIWKYCVTSSKVGSGLCQLDPSVVPFEYSPFLLCYRLQMQWNNVDAQGSLEDEWILHHSIFKVMWFSLFLSYLELPPMTFCLSAFVDISIHNLNQGAFYAESITYSWDNSHHKEMNSRTKWWWMNSLSQGDVRLRSVG